MAKRLSTTTALAVVVMMLAVLGLVHAVRVWLLPDDIDRVVVWTLAFVPARYDTSAFNDGVIPGGWGAGFWSFFTYALLHADWMHLGFNAVWLLAFASPVARRFGTRRFLLFFAATIAGGALAYLLAHAGALAPMIGVARRYDGPMGKSDRALVFGALGLGIGLGLQPAGWQNPIFPVIALLLGVTIVNRVRGAMSESRAARMPGDA